MTWLASGATIHTLITADLHTAGGKIKNLK